MSCWLNLFQFFSLFPVRTLCHVLVLSDTLSLSPMVATIATLEDFNATLDKAGDKLVVVDFTATWCGPCQRIAPIFQKLADENPNVVFIKVDVDENEETAAAYGISAMPTFIFIKNKEKLETMEGANVDKLTSLVQKHA